MLRYAPYFFVLSCSFSHADCPPNAIYQVDETSLNLTVKDDNSVAHEPTKCFILVHRSSMVLLFTHLTKSGSDTEGTQWDITAFDTAGSKSIGYAKRASSRTRQRLIMSTYPDQRLEINLIDDNRKVRGSSETVRFRCSRCDEKAARDAIREILKTKPLRLAARARATIDDWLTTLGGEQRDKHEVAEH